MTSIVVSVINLRRNEEQLNPKAEISCEVSLNIGDGVLFYSPTVIGVSNARIREIVYRSLYSGLITYPLETLERDGILASHSREKLTKLWEDSKEDFANIKCRIPLFLRVKNSGKAATTIVKVSVEFKSFVGETISLTTQGKLNHVVEPNKLLDIDLKGSTGIEMPLFLMTGELMKKRISSPEFVEELKAHKANVIDFEKPAQLLLQDMQGTVTKTELPLTGLQAMFNEFGPK